jgi:hypothetical protein
VRAESSQRSSVVLSVRSGCPVIVWMT